VVVVRQIAVLHHGHAQFNAVCARGWCSVVGCHVAVGNAQFAQHAAQNEGGQCTKAETLRRIQDEIKLMPTTAAECERTLDLLDLRHMVLTAEDVAKLMEETDKALKQEQDLSSSSSSSSASISATPINSSSSENQPKSRLSLSERLWSRKSRESKVSNQSSAISMGYDEDDSNRGDTEVDSQNATRSDEPSVLEMDSQPETQCAGETTSENTSATTTERLSYC
jgi:hypothetical protein